MRNHMILIETREDGKKTVSVGKVAEERLDIIRQLQVRGEEVGQYEVFDADVNAFFDIGKKNSICIKPAERREHTYSVCFRQEKGDSMHPTVLNPDILEGAKHLFSVYHSPTVTIFGDKGDDYPFRVSTEQLFEDWKEAGFPILWKR